MSSDSRAAPVQFRGGGQPSQQHQDHHQQQNNGDSYNGPDSLRNTANKMFSRNGGDRSSGYNGNMNVSQAGGGGGYQSNYGQSLNQSQQNINHSLNHSMEISNSFDQSRQQQSTPSNVRLRQNSSEDPAKRNSYNNQSFRNAIQTPGQLQQPPPKPGQSQRLPPQVPPKPGSRSASKERPKEPPGTNDENDHLETELKNILRGNHKESLDKTNGSGEWS